MAGSPFEFDQVEEAEFWDRLETRLSREDQLFELRRYEPALPLRVPYRASEEAEAA